MQRDKKNSMMNSQIEDNPTGMNIVTDEMENKYTPIYKSFTRAGSYDNLNDKLDNSSKSKKDTRYTS